MLPERWQIRQHAGARDFKAREILRRMTPVEPFGGLSEDWNNSKVLAMWHAVFTWYQMQTDRDHKVFGHWDLFHQPFLAALKSMSTGDVKNPKDRRESARTIRPKARVEAQQKTGKGSTNNNIGRAVCALEDGIRRSVVRLAHESLAGILRDSSKSIMGSVDYEIRDSSQRPCVGYMKQMMKLTMETIVKKVAMMEMRGLGNNADSSGNGGGDKTDADAGNYDH